MKIARAINPQCQLNRIPVCLPDSKEAREYGPIRFASLERLISVAITIRFTIKLFRSHCIVSLLCTDGVPHQVSVDSSITLLIPRMYRYAIDK